MSPIRAPADSRLRYGSVALTIHWATAALVLVAFVYGPGGSELRVYAPARDFERQLHETLGLGVFALVVLCVLWRLVPMLPSWLPVQQHTARLSRVPAQRAARRRRQATSGLRLASMSSTIACRS
jgi:cytochrome b561